MEYLNAQYSWLCPPHLQPSVLNHFSQFYFPIFGIFQFWKDIGKRFGKTFPTRRGFPNAPERSVKIYPTLSERPFLTGVCTHEHRTGSYDDDIKWSVSRPDRLLGMSVTVQRMPSAACAGWYKHNAAREWPVPVTAIQRPPMLWQCRWTTIPVNSAIPTMLKKQSAV